MLFKDFGILLLLLMVVSASPATKSDKDEREHEIYLEEGLEVICGKGAGGGVHITTEPKSGWFCKTGYARDLDGKCVKLEKCNSKSLLTYNRRKCS